MARIRNGFQAWKVVKEADLADCLCLNRRNLDKENKGILYVANLLDLLLVNHESFISDNSGCTPGILLFPTFISLDRHLQVNRVTARLHVVGRR